MLARDFCFWLQGLMEVAKPKKLNEEQTTMIKAHLNLVFAHDIDPKMGNKTHQEILDKIHDWKKPQPGIQHMILSPANDKNEEPRPRC